MTQISIKDEILIAKERELTWNLLTDISGWSRWNRLIRRAAVYGPLKAGTEFKFLSGKWDFEGSILDLAPPSTFVFEAKSIGLRLRIKWVIVEEAKGCTVAANLSASGWMAAFLKRRAVRSFEDALFTWLYAMKTNLERSEKPVALRDNIKPRKKHTLLDPLGLLFKHSKDE